MKTIGARIKKLRKENKVSMATLGKSIGTDSANISNWENNKRIPGGKFIIALSNYFNVSTDWLLKGTIELNDDRQNSFFSEDSNHLHSFVANLPKENQHFVYAFAKFYSEYTLHNGSYNEVIQQHFSLLPLLKQEALHSELLSSEDIETYLPIPNALAEKGDFIYSASSHSPHLDPSGEVELAIVQNQTEAFNGQFVLATYDDQLFMGRLIQDGENWFLKVAKSNEIIYIVNMDHMHVHGIVTGLYNSKTTNPSHSFLHFA
ncbi:helix-turn-helix domain-containing protein [Paraliobacillus salinarum]|uniref:helix-turn-helix domain-containing protein n=1 Tax=Paraliobacillus salinarum TaxID=1158996 RepID=UPI0015F56490|nr:helix-turn-helix domain-containing protein [Paraliobacillus salinarum]